MDEENGSWQVEQTKQALWYRPVRRPSALEMDFPVIGNMQALQSPRDDCIDPSRGRDRDRDRSWFSGLNADRSRLRSGEPLGGGGDGGVGVNGETGERSRERPGNGASPPNCLSAADGARGDTGLRPL